jgi:hypothetical protein
MGLFPLPPVRRQVTRNFTVTAVSGVGAAGSALRSSSAIVQDTVVARGQPVVSAQSINNTVNAILRDIAGTRFRRIVGFDILPEDNSPVFIITST